MTARLTRTGARTPPRCATRWWLETSVSQLICQCMENPRLVELRPFERFGARNGGDPVAHTDAIAARTASLLFVLIGGLGTALQEGVVRVQRFRRGCSRPLFGPLPDTLPISE